MHICTLVGRGVGWRPAAEQIKKRLHLFNGKRVIAIAGGPGCEAASVVKSFFGPDVDYIEVENNHRLREVTSHNLLWERVIDDHDSFTFYCHSKTVTRPPTYPAVHRWTEILFESNLDFLEVVERQFQDRHIIGSFLKRSGQFGKSWHFSGSFYWVRMADLHKRNWREIDKRRHGVESWPAVVFTSRECGVIFCECDLRLNLYQPVSLAEVDKDYAAWKETIYAARSGQHDEPICQQGVPTS